MLSTVETAREYRCRDSVSDPRARACITRARAETGVASTRAFTAQRVGLVLLACWPRLDIGFKE